MNTYFLGEIKEFERDFSIQIPWASRLGRRGWFESIRKYFAKFLKSYTGGFGCALWEDRC
jgi:hypothetical protein